MKWTKENIPPAIREAKNKMESWSSVKFQSFSAHNNKYPSLHTIYKVYDSWDNMIVEVFGEDKLKKQSTKFDDKFDIDIIDKITADCINNDIKKYKGIVEFAEKKGVGYPSLYFLKKKFGSFTEYRSKFTGEESVNVRDEFCRICSVGRCRFNYNLDECEYYEGGKK